MSEPPPTGIDLKKDRGLTIQWADGSGSYYSIVYLRRMSPSADMRELRRAMAANPLTVVPDLTGGDGGPLVATDAELVGNYAMRISFSDGHSTGIYSWDYLREIDPKLADAKNAATGDDPTRITAPKDEGNAHNNPLGLGGP
ncbi:MAG: DUF971 domain-containing protein [Planctomycetota bacterium]